VWNACSDAFESYCGVVDEIGAKPLLLYTLLSVAFGAIVGSAKHLAVIRRASAALAPCGNVVRVHFGQLPYLALIGSMADCAKRTI
jgi:hypothetical protein